MHNFYTSQKIKLNRLLVEDIIGLLSERHPDLLAVILYGSVARHEERPSDAYNASFAEVAGSYQSLRQPFRKLGGS